MAWRLLCVAENLASEVYDEQLLRYGDLRWNMPNTHFTHRPLSSSFLWFIFRIL